MLVTVTYFSHLIRDRNGHVVPVAPAASRQGCVAATAAGDLPSPVPKAAAIARIATDTAVRMRIGGSSAAGASELFMPGVEFVEVIPGTTLAIEAV